MGHSFRKRSDGRMQWNTGVKFKGFAIRRPWGYLLVVWSWTGNSNTLGLQAIKWEPRHLLHEVHARIKEILHEKHLAQ